MDRPGRLTARASAVTRVVLANAGSGACGPPRQVWRHFLADMINLPGFPVRIVAFLEFLGRHVTAGRMQPFPVVPGHPFESREHDICRPGPRPVPLDKLFLVKTVPRLRGRIVIRVALASDRADRADLAEPLGVPY